MFVIAFVFLCFDANLTYHHREKGLDVIGDWNAQKFLEGLLCVVWSQDRRNNAGHIGGTGTRELDDLPNALRLVTEFVESGLVFRIDILGDGGSSAGVNSRSTEPAHD